MNSIVVLQDCTISLNRGWFQLASLMFFKAQYQKVLFAEEEITVDGQGSLFILTKGRVTNF